MKYILKQMSQAEKPRERMKRYGACNLSDYELLSVILKSGIKGKSVINLSLEIMEHFSNVYNLSSASFEELVRIKGLGEAKALEILAVSELGKRMVSPFRASWIIKNSEDVYYYVYYNLVNKTQEHLICIYLDIKSNVINMKIITIGSISKTTVDHLSAMKWALKLNAYAVVFVHNHPSGNPEPSFEDTQATKLFQKACKEVGIVYIDHVIIGEGSCFSYKTKQIRRVGI